MLKNIGLVFICGGIFAALAFYWYYSDIYPSTENAYVQATVLSVAPRVEGQIEHVWVDDYQHVNKGDELLELDAAPYVLAQKQAKAAYLLAVQQHKADASAVDAAIASLDKAEADLKNAQLDYRRTMALVQQQLASVEDGDDARTVLAEDQASLEAARANLQQAIATRGTEGLDSAIVQQAAAQLGQAELNLSYTRISAPYSGIVGEINVHKGTVTMAGQSLFPLVKDNSYWMQANYKEANMGRIRVGQPVKIEIDMFPDYHWQGKVVNISPASGASFSLLPPENATGNWVKIPQRFSVKISMFGDEQSPPLRVGASGAVRIDTRQ